MIRRRCSTERAHRRHCRSSRIPPPCGSTSSTGSGRADRLPSHVPRHRSRGRLRLGQDHRRPPHRRVARRRWLKPATRRARSGHSRNRSPAATPPTRARAIPDICGCAAPENSRTCTARTAAWTTPDVSRPIYWLRCRTPNLIFLCSSSCGAGRGGKCSSAHGPIASARGSTFARNEIENGEGNHQDPHGSCGSAP